MTDREALEQRFNDKFANPDRLSSTSQFNPELAGRLYQEFLTFLESETTQAYAKGREKGQTDRIAVSRTDGIYCQRCGNKISENKIRGHGIDKIFLDEVKGDSHER